MQGTGGNGIFRPGFSQISVAAEAGMVYDKLNHIALVVMYIGFFGWLFSTGMFIYRGFRSDGRPRFKKALFWFAAIFIMLGIWIAGLVFLGYEA